MSKKKKSRRSRKHHAYKFVSPDGSVRIERRPALPKPKRTGVTTIREGVPAGTEYQNTKIDFGPFNARAAEAFASLDALLQSQVLWWIARFARVSPTDLYATAAQREAERTIDAEIRIKKRNHEARMRQRMNARCQLNALHNRAQRRRHQAFTPTEERRREELYARLNEIDGIDGASRIGSDGWR